MKINWYDKASHAFLNPRIKIPFDLKKVCSRIESHIWLQTSGASKLVGLSKEAILSSAESVNKHIGASSLDIWLDILPEFHIGSVSIFARAELSGSKVISCPFVLGKWSPIEFTRVLQETKATLTSLVPTHVYDVVKNQIQSPEALRIAFVGGSELDPWLMEEAKILGWPLVPTYGMTECSSQIATAKADNKNLKILNHVELRVNEAKKICIKSISLLTEYCVVDATGNHNFFDPKINNEFVSEDLGYILGKFLVPLGRGADFLKVGGEGVYLNKLRAVLHQILWQNKIDGGMELVGVVDKRLGSKVGLIATLTSHEVSQKIVHEFNLAVTPYERIQEVRFVESISRNEMGKISV